MDELVTAVPTGLVAFTATNIDDVVMLTLFFSQVNAVFRSRHVVVGQYLGFGALVVASLPGFFGGLIVPRAWIGMLGAIPIQARGTTKPPKKPGRLAITKAPKPRY